MKSWIIGITGLIASGKSTASHYIADRYNLHLIDADKIGHQVLQDPKTIQALASEFPSAYRAERKSMNREALSDIVFHSDEKLLLLQSITWPYILNEVYHQISNHPKCVIEAIGLFQTNLYKKCNHTIYIDCPIDIIKDRLQARGLPKDKINGILLKQKTIQEKQQLASVCLKNNLSVNCLYSLLDQVMKNWRKV